MFQLSNYFNIKALLALKPSPVPLLFKWCDCWEQAPKRWVRLRKLGLIKTNRAVPAGGFSLIEGQSGGPDTAVCAQHVCDALGIHQQYSHRAGYSLLRTPSVSLCLSPVAYHHTTDPSLLHILLPFLPIVDCEGPLRSLRKWEGLLLLVVSVVAIWPMCAGYSRKLLCSDISIWEKSH